MKSNRMKNNQNLFIVGESETRSPMHYCESCQKKRDEKGQRDEKKENEKKKEKK